MALTKQECLRHTELVHYFDQVFNGRAERLGVTPWVTASNGWEINGYIDGPVTFVICTDLDSGQSYTGWSKFDNTGKYTEHGGIYKAIQKAVEKYMRSIVDHHFDDLACNPQAASSLDPFIDWGSGTEEGETHAVQAHQDTAGVDPVRQAS
jgi:hypothetical protein